MILALDTSAGSAAALVDGQSVRAEAAVHDTRRHAEVVGTLLTDVLRAADATVHDLSAVAVGMGPGPYTGLRVGIAAARAFALGADLPVLGVVTHDAIALDLLTAADTAREDAAADLIVVTDARRREQYWSRYSGLDADGVPIRTAGPAVAKPDDVPTDGEAVLVAEVLASSVGRLAARLRAADREFTTGEPLYLRSPDVTLPAARKRVTP